MLMKSERATDTLQPTAIVIDDSISARALIRTSLIQAGIRVVAEASTGTALLALYDTHKPTMVVLDIVLPEVDGITILKELMKKDPQANVVVCTAFTAPDKQHACIEAGAKHLLLKPFAVSGCVQALSGFLHRIAPAAS